MPLRRDLLVIEVGPDVKGSMPGMEGCAQVPEKSGMDTAGAAARPKTGIAAAAANVTSKRRFRRRRFMRRSLSRVHRHVANKCYTACVCTRSLRLLPGSGACPSYRWRRCQQHRWYEQFK